MANFESLLQEKDNWRMLHGVLSLLEPYEVKVSSTVLRGERGRNASDLPDTIAA
jgi:hypothetical protein